MLCKGIKPANERQCVARKASKVMRGNSAASVTSFLRLPQQLLGLLSYCNSANNRCGASSQYEICAYQHRLFGSAVSCAQQARICSALCLPLSSDTPNWGSNSCFCICKHIINRTTQIECQSVTHYSPALHSYWMSFQLCKLDSTRMPILANNVHQRENII